MSDNTDDGISQNTYTDTLYLRISPELSDKIQTGAAATKLGRSAMLRLAIERGIDRLLEQLEVTTTNTGDDQ